MDNILEVNNLCKTYITNKRQNNVLRNVTFNIGKGEMVAIMGPSGSGKSTLLYSVSGMDKATAGQVMFRGKDICTLTEKDMARVRLDDMGFIFQQMFMMKNLTILDNIALPAIQSRKNSGSRKEKFIRARDLMQKMGISEIADNDINEVSGGQLQRACICRSLINEPEIIFADEPTGALNRASSDEVMDELTRINREGSTVMMVTHDVKVAARCSRVLFLVDGNIKGEYRTSDKCSDNASLREREMALNAWLIEMGW